jgi:DNA-binding response OmpR family regulator
LINKKNPEHKIMIVDDDEDILLTFKISLEDEGFRVDTFADPLMAISAFKANKENNYELLLVDLYYRDQYPDINLFNGFKVYEEMRKSGKKMPPMCIITSFQQNYDILKPTFPDVPQCFIKKPIEQKDLIAKARQEISGSI